MDNQFYYKKFSEIVFIYSYMPKHDDLLGGGCLLPRVQVKG